MKHRFIFVFIDGVGLADAGPDNPLSPDRDGDEEWAAPLPVLTAALGVPLLAGRQVYGQGRLLKAIDATLGVPGRPQSATGQAALYTGRNAPAFLGRHLTGFANGSLRILIEESGLFKQALELGRRVTSANLYSPGYFEAIERRRLRYSVGALLNLTAGVPFRMPEDYRQGEAVFWDITSRHLPERGLNLPPITPFEAGQRLARIARSHDVTLFESYLTDFAGHAQDQTAARDALEQFDGLVAGTLEDAPAGTTLVISSDHGNLENLGTRLHTLNPVPLIAIGPAAHLFEPITDIMGLTPAILEGLKGEG